MAMLFTPFTLRGLTFPNRVAMPPMAQYMATGDGLPTYWHLVHYGARAVGRTGLLIVEVTSVDPGGRLTPRDLGLWQDEQVTSTAQMVQFLHTQGSVVAVQLGHAGRKAWGEEKGFGSTPLVSSTPEPFDEGWAVPREMDETEISHVVEAFRQATRRAMEAGYDLVEIHAAHGYLLHQFLSPLVNKRRDAYGGALTGRMRLLLEVARAVRAATPQDKPLFVRLSCTDWAEAGLTPSEIVEVARALKEEGVDLVHCSSGGAVPWAVPQPFPNYQVAFAEQVRREAGIPTCAVGLITEPSQAEEILQKGQADLVAVGRELLRNPYWPLQAARALDTEIEWPAQYLRAKPQ
ncbi:MAG: NADH:flavin oxidoreductase/NADH oxidase [Coprothermobacterota bacterium]|nr:NADH:flavin oxidoreductase/NADH oxidase [Coprothermobacterota bacterium]